MEDMTAFAAPSGADGCGTMGVAEDDTATGGQGAHPQGNSTLPGTETDATGRANMSLGEEASIAPLRDITASEGAPEDGAENVPDGAAAGQPTDYAALAAEDLDEIKRLAPSLAGLSHLAELPNALRYAALRDAGLSVEEALYAACHAFVVPRVADNRAHLRSAVPISATGTPSRMSAAEMREARELFGDLTEGEIEHLYARCQTE